MRLAAVKLDARAAVLHELDDGAEATHGVLDAVSHRKRELIGCRSSGKASTRPLPTQIERAAANAGEHLRDTARARRHSRRRRRSSGFHNRSRASASLDGCFPPGGQPGTPG